MVAMAAWTVEFLVAVAAPTAEAATAEPAFTVAFFGRTNVVLVSVFTYRVTSHLDSYIVLQ